ncbi:MAG: MlaD family protein [Brevinematales bacterium]|nr:MlaD family protein [Brevinematales bacterium]
MPFTFRAMEKLVAAFIVLGLIFFVVMIVLLGRGSYIFRFKDTYYTILHESYGFSSGSQIKYKGINIGKVKSVKLMNDENVRVDFIILREYRNYIRENSVMKVQSTILGSANFVLIKPEGVNYKIIEPGGRVLSSDDEEGMAVLKKYDESLKKDDLTATAKKILDNIDSLKPVINQTMYNVKDITEGLKVIVYNFRELAIDLNSTNNTIGSIVKDKKALLNKIDRMLASIDITLKNISDISTKFKNTPDDVKGTMVLLQENLIESKKVLIGLKNLVGGEKENVQKMSIGERER